MLPQLRNSTIQMIPASSLIIVWLEYTFHIAKSFCCVCTVSRQPFWQSDNARDSQMNFSGASEMCDGSELPTDLSTLCMEASRTLYMSGDEMFLIRAQYPLTHNFPLAANSFKCSLNAIKVYDFYFEYRRVNIGRIQTAGLLSYIESTVDYYQVMPEMFIIWTTNRKTVSLLTSMFWYTRKMHL